MCVCYLCRDGEVYITSLDTLTAPTVFAPGPSSSSSSTIAQPHGVNITSLAWNMHASHILAAGASSGATSIWDLKQKRPWCHVIHNHNHHAYDEGRSSFSSPLSTVVAWSPKESLHLITASAATDRQNGATAVRLWDLRGSRTTPLLEFYEPAVTSLAWSYTDPGSISIQ
jgi:WD40 repeat protein